MGAVRFLCITILLVALAVAQDCNSNGHLNAHGDCICNSGFNDTACGTNFGTDSVTGCNIGATAALERKDDRFPVLDDVVDTITFRNNILKLAIASEIVPKRRYESIVFIPQGSTVAGKCNLNGTSTDASYWTQTAQSSLGKCRDSFVLRMPWTSWQDCGFAEAVGELPSFWVYRATFVATYVDDIGTPFNFAEVTYKPEMYRKSAVAYKVYVRFQKIVEIISSTVVTVNNTVGLQVAITKFEYDPATQNVTFGISSIVMWPAMLIRDTVTLTIQTGSATTASFSFDLTQGQTGHPTQDATADELTKYCRTDKYWNCLQYFEFVMHLDTGCDFNAVYILSGDVTTCRDTPHDCTISATESFVTVSKSDVCGHVTAEPIITGNLMSYDENHNSKTEFKVGYRGYFEVDMQSSNDFNLTWIDIWVVPDSAVPDITQIDSVTIPEIQWLYKDGVTRVDGFHKFDGSDFPAGHFGVASPVDLHVYDVSRNSNTEVIFTPKFDFLFDSRIFHIPLTGDVKKGHTLHAKGKIVYANNEQYGKRTEATEEVVDFVWKTDASGLDGMVRFDLVSQTSSNSAVESSSNTKVALLASLVPVAGIALVVIAVAIVAAVVIVRRKKSSAFATLN